MARQYSACLSRVFGSKPPASFLDELVDWALLAPDEIFLPNAGFDIYSSVVTPKSNHKLAIEYAARLLRVSVTHHGTIKHHHIHPELKKAAVAEFRGYLENIGDFPTPPDGASYA